MTHRLMSVRTSAILTVIGLVLLTSRTHADTILISGNSFDPFNANFTGAIAGLGHTATIVAPANFAATSFSGFKAIWLDGFSQYGGGAWPANLVAFMNAGGNVFIQNPGFGSENISTYPLATSVT